MFILSRLFAAGPTTGERVIFAHARDVASERGGGCSCDRVQGRVV